MISEMLIAILMYSPVLDFMQWTLQIFGESCGLDCIFYLNGLWTEVLEIHESKEQKNGGYGVSVAVNAWSGLNINVSV